MFRKSSHPTYAALQAVAGIFLAAVTVYLFVNAPELLRGEHRLDWQLIRLMAVVGLLTLGVSLVENKALA